HTPSVHVTGDGMGCDPLAVGVLEKVLAGISAGIRIRGAEVLELRRLLCARRRRSRRVVAGNGIGSCEHTSCQQESLHSTPQKDLNHIAAFFCIAKNVLYQILHAFWRAIGLPFLQLNAAQNSGMLFTTLFTRYFGSECGLVST